MIAYTKKGAQGASPSAEPPLSVIQSVVVSESDPILGLPPELVHAIFSFTDVVDLMVCRFVCTHWRDALATLSSSLFPNTPQLSAEEFCTQLAGRGYVSLMEWARSRGYGWEPRACLLAAAAAGSIEVIRWIQRECGDKEIWHDSICAAAAKRGQLKLLKWVRKKGCPWKETTCTGAAEGGHIKVLKWARRKGCEWDEHACSAAAKYGHLDVLHWLRENGECPWNEWTTALLAEGGHLEVHRFCLKVDRLNGVYQELKWAREQGCAWNSWVCSYAAHNGHVDTLRWAREQVGVQHTPF